MDLKYYYLDYFIMAYFHQDWRMEGDTIEEIVSNYLKEANQEHFEGITKEIDILFQQETEVVEQIFLKRYEWDFDPNLSGMTVKAFLTYVRQQIVAQLEQHHSS